MSQPLPGWQAQSRMAPAPRPLADVPCGSHEHHRRAGVLVLLYPGGAPLTHPANLSLVLTLRTETLNSHRGQISLPGGQVEAGETAVSAALREAKEELSIDSEDLEVVGQLTPLYIPVSDTAYIPWSPFLRFVPPSGRVQTK
jgi:8-oxo-dGTP pyrophosphatase MutT (NUDIX family)